MHLIHTLYGVLDTNGQHHRRQAKPVAQLVSLLNRAQVHGHHGANLLAPDVVTMRLQIFANGPGHAAQQHIIDGAIQRLAHGFHLFQRNGLAPRHTLGGAGYAFQPRGGVIGHQRQGSRVAECLVGHPGQIEGTGQALFHPFLRLRQHFQRIGRSAASRVQSPDGNVGERLDQGIGQPVFCGFQALAVGFRRLARGWRKTPIHQRLRYGNQRDAVCYAMVDTYHHG